MNVDISAFICLTPNRSGTCFFTSCRTPAREEGKYLQDYENIEAIENAADPGDHERNSASHFSPGDNRSD